MPQLTRRSFLKGMCAFGAAVATGTYGFFSYISRKASRKKNSLSIDGFCSHCSMGCAHKIYYKDKSVISVEGRSESPVNRGMLCPKGKGSARELFEEKETKAKIYKSDRQVLRTTRDEGLMRAVQLIKGERDRSFTTDLSGITVNRLESVAAICGNYVSNETAYIFNKFCRICGIKDVGTQAQLQSKDTQRAFSATFGIPAQPNPWHDLRFSDVIVIIGANPVKTTPLAVSHIVEARRKGASVITISPEKNETSILSDLHISINPGTDISFLMGLIRYSLVNKKYNVPYITDNTDAPFLVSDDFIAQSKGEKFPGFDEGSGRYMDMTSWSYIIDERGNPKADNNLNRENCVLNVLKDHYKRYTPDWVIRTSGCTADSFLLAADLFFDTAVDDRSASIIYGGGLSDSAGVQGVRALSMLQLLAGNIGAAGGGIYGINAKGNSQGVMDQIGLWNMLPGYIPLPNGEINEDYQSYIKNNTLKSNDQRSVHLWSGFDAYSKSMLAAWFDDTAENAFSFLPRRGELFSANDFLSGCYTGEGYRGVILLDSDLLDSGYNRETMKTAIKQLDWIILIRRGHHNKTVEYISSLSEECNVECVDIPVFSSDHSVQSFTSGDRVLYSGDSLQTSLDDNTDLGVIAQLFNRLRNLYLSDGGSFTEPFRKARWNYPDYNAVQNEIEGIGKEGETDDAENRDAVRDRCGNWLYSGLYTGIKELKRSSDSPDNRKTVFPRWYKSWPRNSRILFNRAVQKSEKSEIAERDVRIFSDKKDIRPFYFDKEGVARFFARIPEGPFPLPSYTIKGESREALEYQIFSRDTGELSYSHEDWGYKEIYAGPSVCIHQNAARKGNLRSGDRVTLANGYGSIVLPIHISDNSGISENMVKISGDGIQSLQRPYDGLHDYGILAATLEKEQ